MIELINHTAVYRQRKSELIANWREQAKELRNFARHFNALSVMYKAKTARAEAFETCADELEKI